MAFSFKSFAVPNFTPGRYKAKITDIKKKTSGTEADAFDLAVVYTVVDGPMTGKTLHDTIYHKSFGFRLTPFMEAAGLDINREFTSVDELMAYGIKEIKDRVLFIDVENKEYNGKTYTNIKTWSNIPTSISTAEEVMAEFDLPFADEATEIKTKLKNSVKDVADSDSEDTPKSDDGFPAVDFNLDDFNV